MATMRGATRVQAGRRLLDEVGRKPVLDGRGHRAGQINQEGDGQGSGHSQRGSQAGGQAHHHYDHLAGRPDCTQSPQPAGPGHRRRPAPERQSHRTDGDPDSGQHTDQWPPDGHRRGSQQRGNERQVDRDDPHQRMANLETEPAR